MIIGISGKKQSGKDSLANYVQALYFTSTNIENSCDSIIVQHDTTDIRFFIDQDDRTADLEQSFNICKEKEVKQYNFSDSIKTDICHKILGIPLRNLYGTDSEKNEIVDYLWDNLPMDLRMSYSNQWEKYEHYDSMTSNSTAMVTNLPRTGNMTAREIMQIIGTDIFRNMFDKNVWVKATINKIKQDKQLGLHIALIPDVRFPSEVDAIIANDGYVVRLERDILEDNHESENALNGYDFTQYGDRALVIKNENLTIGEKNYSAKAWLLKSMSKVINV